MDEHAELSRIHAEVRCIYAVCTIRSTVYLRRTKYVYFESGNNITLFEYAVLQGNNTTLFEYIVLYRNITLFEYAVLYCNTPY